MEQINITIHPLSLEEIPLIDKLQQHNHEKLLSLSLLKEEYLQDQIVILGAYHNKQLVAMLSASKLYDHLDIQGILVDANYRKQKIGTKLLTVLQDYAKQHGYCAIFLEVRTNNTIALKFYEALGYKRIHVRKQYYTDTNEDAIIYKQTWMS